MKRLSPVQTAALRRFEELLPCGNIFVVSGATGSGKSTLLRAIRERIGGSILNSGEFLELQRTRHPIAFDETFGEHLRDLLNRHSAVLVDDIHWIEHISSSHLAPRHGMLNVVLNHACSEAIRLGKKLVFTTMDDAPSAVKAGRLLVKIGAPNVEEYRFFLRQYLKGSKSAALNAQEIFSFASNLDGHQLRSLCQVLSRRRRITTGDFLQYILDHKLISNVSLNHVEAVELSDLRGMDSILETLEAQVVLPFENAELAKKFDLNPKKGVLLYGPPGTGKTSIGRALACRLKGKFFQIDGTFVHENKGFFEGIQEIFERAKQNAPSVIFIDDSDVLFENDVWFGLYRFLLTELDGLENEKNSGVTVIMTAMEVDKLPYALLRSGRLELWLELHLPDETARTEILRHRMKNLHEHFHAVDITALVAETDGFTGADLRSVVEQGKNLYAHGFARGRNAGDPTPYFLAAARSVRENREKKNVIGFSGASKGRRVSGF
jgi:predicted AAA+ superfamily ATPase